MEKIMYKSTKHSFSFKAGQLAEKLMAVSINLCAGYWQYQEEKSAKNQSPKNWFLGVYQGKIVYSGVEKLSWKSFLATMVRYIPGLDTKIKQALLSIEQKMCPDRSFNLTKMLEAIEKTSLITKQQALAALKLKILSDFDSYLFTTSGTFKFYSQYRFLPANSTLGFDLGKLIEQAKQRSALWQELKTQIPSVDSKLRIDRDLLSRSQLTSIQKQRLQAILKNGKTLEGIATHLSKDPLEIAKIFAPFARCGLIRTDEPLKSRDINTPKIMLVDDSPILTKQFQHLVTKWGYQLQSCHEPQCAIEAITNYHPQIIFIDINMPGISGFDLVKSIRKQSEIASIPTVILTGENKLSNKWQANWSNCKFLLKPIAIEEINLFKTELHDVLEDLIPTENKAVVA